MAEEDDSQATLQLPEDGPAPFRVQLRIISCEVRGSNQSAVEGPQYRSRCLGRLTFPPFAFGKGEGKYHAAVYYNDSMVSRRDSQTSLT